MQGFIDTVKAHPFMSLAIVIIIMVLLMAIVGMASSKSEHLPWGKKVENFVYPGDLTPSEQKLLRQRMQADPVNSAHIKKEYLSNKAEVPSLVAKLYQ